jgi:hypothetical protein
MSDVYHLFFHDLIQADIFPDKNHGGRVFYNEAMLGASRIPQVKNSLEMDIVIVY